MVQCLLQLKLYESELNQVKVLVFFQFMVDMML